MSFSNIRIAVLQFPGANCEFETKSVLEFAGMDAEIFRWNRDPVELRQFDGFVLPGGFSYQDRIRAGAVAAKKDIVKILLEVAQNGAPVLGICNGAQVLVETGMVPGLEWGKIQMALAPNRNGKTSGYYCNWVHIKANVTDRKNAFNRLFENNQIIPAPIAHAEGRFTTRDQSVLEKLAVNNQIAFQYCKPDGAVSLNFPFNPNGALLGMAGVTNPDGNVLALMPHPERSGWMRQVPDDIQRMLPPAAQTDRSLNHLRNPGPGLAFFLSMKQYIQDRKSI